MKNLLFLTTAMVCLFVATACKTSQKSISVTAISATESGDNALLEKYWKLDQIMGKDVATLTPRPPKDAFLTFKAEEKRLVGNLGCNTFSAEYELMPGNRIRISNAINTEMMCMTMTVEDEMKQVLATADSYSVHNDTLVLNRARMAPLARFVVVYME
ncbi:MAG: META domain-containing protein [Dysgonamonadaceae bacterium]|nr:META domain-containing protein [Dysgonamonadaceae bacterium]